MKYFVIGLSNSADHFFSEEVKLILAAQQVFSGGIRHYHLIKKHLPPHHIWIEIKGEMRLLFEQYRNHETIIVFASGDPLFYGFANTIQKFDPSAEMQTYPWFNSLQVLCHKALVPYGNITYASVHGRSWHELDAALIKQSELIGVLTDYQKNPGAIAQRMLEYGFDNYEIIIGEALEGPEEQVYFLNLSEAASKIFHRLNCVLLCKTYSKAKSFGIDDDSFEGLPDRPNMITKKPIRLTTLSSLDLKNKNTFWDIGFCTGSVSIEAKNQFPEIKVVAFEKRVECDALLEKNARINSAPGILKVMGDFFVQDLSNLPAPDAIFIGGHGNRLEEMILKVDGFLKNGGRLGINAVKEDSKIDFIRTTKKLGYNAIEPTLLRVDDHNVIAICTAEKPF